MSDSDASDKVHVSIRLDEMHLRHDSSNITGESRQNFDSAEGNKINDNANLNVFFVYVALTLRV